MPPRQDVIAAGGATLAAAALRLPNLGRPGELVFDETYYVRDALVYLGRGGEEITYVHPPLGKWLTAAGIAAWGDDPTGWRVAAAAAGLVTVVLTYLLARLVLSWPWATAAAGLVAFDGLSIVQSRTAMLDGFLPPLLLGGALMLYRRADAETLGRWRLCAGGALLGAAVAVKWTAAPVLLGGAVALAVTSDPRLRRRIEVGACVLGSAAIVYLASYARFWAANGPDVPAFVRLHRSMLDYHQTLTETHPYGSRAWEWLPMRRPVAYFFAQGPQGVQEVLAVGNPALWWAFLLVLPFVAWRWWRQRDRVADLVVLGTATLFVPWLLVLRQGFLFYLTPFVPIMAIGVSWALAALWTRWRASRPGVVLYCGVVAGVALWMLPIWTGAPMSSARWDQLLLFDSWI